MKKIISIIIILTNSISTNIYSQELSEKKYKYVIKEDFNEEGGKFPIQNLEQEYTLIDNNEYLIINNTNNKKKVTTYVNIKNDFLLETEIKIGPTRNKNTSSGIILTNNKNKIVFEVNTKSKYRIKKNNKYLSRKNKGWKKNKHIKGVNKYNSIVLKSENKHIRILVNNNFIDNIPINKNNIDSIGFYLDANSKIRTSYFYLKEKHNNINKEYIKKEKIYTIQIGAFKNKQNKINNLDYTIWTQKTEYNSYIYFCGKFDTANKATKYKEELIKIGYKNVFVLLKNQ